MEWKEIILYRVLYIPSEDALHMLSLPCSSFISTSKSCRCCSTGIEVGVKEEGDKG